ncbi:DUF4221 family protein [Roseivirga misakiensis]|nr:DUF4221 family protein [Roseivirga misakiensis]
MASCSDPGFVYSEFASLDSLEIEMPKDYLQFTSWSNYVDQDRNILVEYGLNSKSDLVIHQIDFISGKYRDPIIIEREGPEGHNSTDVSVFFKSNDSIYLFPAARQHFYLFGGDGRKIDRYPYNSSDYSRYYRAGYYSNAILNEGELIIPVVNDIRYDDPLYFSKTVPIKYYDFEQSRFDRQISYPNYVFGNLVPSSYTGPTVSKYDRSSFLINYRFSDSLYIWNFESEEMTSLYCGSEYFGSPKLLQSYPDQAKELEYKILEVDFEQSFRNDDKLYRIVAHLSDQKFREVPVFEIIDRGYRVMSLIELDLNTQELSYYKLPIAKYFVFDGSFLYAGGVSIREEGDLTFRRFYRYSLN